MKKQILTTMSLIFLTMTSIIFSQSVVVKPNYFDAWVSYDGATGVAAVNDYGDNLLINNGTGITPETSKLNCAVMNFLLPAIPSGTSLIGASFTATSVRKDAGVNSNGDLYGINFRESDRALTTDYFTGTFTAGPNVANGSDWGIMDDMFQVSDPSNGTGVMITPKTTDANANLQLLAFIRKQYLDGGVNKYAFLRLSLDNPASAIWQRYSIASEANVANAPKLTLTFGNGTAVEIIKGANFVAYANNQKQIVVEGDILVGSELTVYGLGGKMITSKFTDQRKFIFVEAFEAGNYLLQINNQGKVFTQKLIVK